MIDKEWQKMVRMMVVDALSFLSADAGWKFAAGGVASEMILEYTSDDMTVAVTISPMELPFLTIKHHRAGSRVDRVRFAATADRVASKYARDIYRETESKKLQQIPEALASLIRQYIEIQAGAVRKYLDPKSRRVRKSGVWKSA
jgi:hypothetical protein